MAFFFLLFYKSLLAFELKNAIFKNFRYLAKLSCGYIKNNDQIKRVGNLFFLRGYYIRGVR